MPSRATTTYASLLNDVDSLVSLLRDLVLLGARQATTSPYSERLSCCL